MARNCFRIPLLNFMQKWVSIALIWIWYFNVQLSRAKSWGGLQTQGIQVNMGWTLESFDRRFVATLESYPCAEIHNRKKESHLLATSIKQPTIVHFCKLKPVIIPHHVEKMPFLQYQIPVHPLLPSHLESLAYPPPS